MIVLIFFLGKEHWIGLETIHKLTNQAGRHMQLKITLEKFTGEKVVVYYDTFILGDKVCICRDVIIIFLKKLKTYISFLLYYSPNYEKVKLDMTLSFRVDFTS